MLSRLIDPGLVLLGAIGATALVWAVVVLPRLFERSKTHDRVAGTALLWVVGVGPLLLGALSPRASGTALTRAALAQAAMAASGTVQSPAGPWRHLGQAITTATFVLTLVIIVSSLSSRWARGRLVFPAVVTAALVYQGTRLISAVGGTKPALGRNLLVFPLAVLAFAALRDVDLEWALAHLRRILRVYVYPSLVLAASAPSYALTANENKRTLFGLGQLRGVTVHPNVMGPVAATALIFELVDKKRTRWHTIHVLAAIVAVVLSQSRTSALLAVLGVLLVEGVGSKVLVRLSRAAVGVTVAFLMATLVARPDAVPFLRSGVDADITTLNGRTRIWGIAIGEFHRNPIFGYGPTLFDATYRRDVLFSKLGFAGQAHNQLVQTLGDSGIIGLLGLVVFVACLVMAGFRASKATGRLSVALVVALLVRSTTETPLRAGGLDVPVFLLVATVLVLTMGLRTASASADEVVARKRRQRI